MARLNAALEAVRPGIRVEQQSVTLVVQGDDAEGILAQACAVDLTRELAERWCTRRWLGRLAGAAARRGWAARVPSVGRLQLGSLSWEALPPLPRILLAPKRRTEQHQERKNLQSPNQHSEAEDPLGDRIDVAVMVDDFPQARS